MTTKLKTDTNNGTHDNGRRSLGDPVERFEQREGKSMKASVYHRFGPPEVLEIVEVDKPAPKSNEVLIRIHAASATAADSAFIRGKPLAARLANGVFKPWQKVLGSEFAGEVESIGDQVTRFKPGDHVVAVSGSGFGDMLNTSRCQKTVRSSESLRPWITTKPSLSVRVGSRPCRSSVTRGGSLTGGKSLSTARPAR